MLLSSDPAVSVTLLPREHNCFHPVCEVARAELDQPFDNNSPFSVVGLGTHRTATDAITIARAECAERYAMAAVAWERLSYASFGSSPMRLHPRLFQCLTRERAAAFDLSFFSPRRSYYWMPATNVVTGCSVEVLADLCCIYRPPGYTHRLAWPTSSGVAAHTTQQAAQRAAILELYERDALMGIWMRRCPMPHIPEKRLSSEAREYLENVRAAGYTCLSLDASCRGVPVVFAIAHRPHAPALVFHAAARPSLSEAATAAWKEADVELFLRLRALSQGTTEIRVEDVISAEDHGRFYDNPAQTQYASFLWDHTAETSHDLDECIGMPETATGFDLRTFCHRQQLDAVYEVRYGSVLGFQVVCLLTPKLIPVSFGWNQFPVQHPARRLQRFLCRGSRWPGTSLPPHPLS